MKLVGRDFQANDAVLAEFRSYLGSRKLRYTQAELDENRETIVHLIEDEILRQVFGEGEARRRSVAWDPQVKKALELVPKAELLLRDPKTFVAEREHDRRLADAVAAVPRP